MAYASSFSMDYHSLPLALLILLWGVVLASSGPAPASLDWRKSGVVTPVKNQRLCDHSWAFAAVSLVESALLFNYSTPRGLDLSEQQVLDCSNGRGNLGCITGTVLDALNYIKTRGGLFTELQYLYNGVSTGDCSQPLGTLVSTLGLKQYLMDRSNETALAASLAIYGPAVVTICPPFNLDTYSGGIYSNGNCHANCDYVDRISMTLVGYGTEQGVDYWILKNSWGTLWGERGYIKLHRGRNMCGILNNPSYFIPRN